MAGIARTVRCWPGDARGLWQAVAMAQPGDVLVADVGNSPQITALGGSTVRASLARGVAGIVTNGAIRDSAEVATLGLPVFATGRSLRGTHKNVNGKHGLTLAMGNATVSPGDLVFGDDDGVLAVRADHAEILLANARAQLDYEREIDRDLEAGGDPLTVLGLAPDPTRDPKQA